MGWADTFEQGVYFGWRWLSFTSDGSYIRPADDAVRHERMLDPHNSFQFEVPRMPWLSLLEPICSIALSRAWGMPRKLSGDGDDVIRRTRVSDREFLWDFISTVWTKIESGLHIQHGRRTSTSAESSLCAGWALHSWPEHQSSWRGGPGQVIQPNQLVYPALR